MCELNLVKTVCYSKVINYLFIIIIKNMPKQFFFFIIVVVQSAGEQ